MKSVSPSSHCCCCRHPPVRGKGMVVHRMSPTSTRFCALCTGPGHAVHRAQRAHIQPTKLVQFLLEMDESQMEREKWYTGKCQAKENVTNWKNNYKGSFARVRQLKSNSVQENIQQGKNLIKTPMFWAIGDDTDHCAADRQRGRSCHTPTDKTRKNYHI